MEAKPEHPQDLNKVTLLRLFLQTSARNANLLEMWYNWPSLELDRPSLPMIHQGLRLAAKELDRIDETGEERGMRIEEALGIMSQKTPLSEANLEAHNSLPEKDRFGAWIFQHSRRLSDNDYERQELPPNEIASDVWESDAVEAHDTTTQRSEDFLGGAASGAAEHDDEFSEPTASSAGVKDPANLDAPPDSMTEHDSVSSELSDHDSAEFMDYSLDEQISAATRTQSTADYKAGSIQPYPRAVT